MSRDPHSDRSPSAATNPWPSIAVAFAVASVLAGVLAWQAYRELGVRHGATRYHEIDGVDPQTPEISADAGRCAGVDDRGVAAFANDGGVGLADVEEVDFELLGGERAGQQPEKEGERFDHAARNLANRSAR